MKRLLCSALIMCAPIGTYAANADLVVATNRVRTACGNISDALGHLKTMAGINTAITGVGTVAGGVALGTGIAKAATDKKIDELDREIIAALEEDGAIRIATPDQFAEIFGGYLINTGNPELVRAGIALQQKQALEKKSKQLGNWRTGTLAANTATNIAGTVIAARNQIDDNLQSRIDACISAVDNLSRVSMTVRLNETATQTELADAQKIIDACREYNGINLGDINKRAKGAAISSGVGSAIGFTGTITSALANNNTGNKPDRAKEKNLNTTANVMAGGATVASGVATIFNATQIGMIKKAVIAADKCEGALK